MPRIRKKTTKRGTTFQRSKIKHKAAESRKKAKRAEKTNKQWKSKQPKDPGIPNSFPFKDQILAEIAEERRQVEEAKQRKKEGKKKAKAGGAHVGDAVDEDADADGEEGGAFDGVSSVQLGRATAAAKGKQAVAEDEDEEEEKEEEEAPALLNTEFPTLAAVLAHADVVLHVLDARDPLACRSKHLEELAAARGARTVFVLNKIDLVPRESVQAWAAHLRGTAPTFLFRAATAYLPLVEPLGASAKTKTRAQNGDALGADVLVQALLRETGRKGVEPLCVAVVGVANTGKSALVNSLVKKSVCDVYKQSAAAQGPSTTEQPQNAVLSLEGKTIRLVDTPALVWEITAGMDAEAVGRVRGQDMLLRSKGRIERVKDPLPALTQIVWRAATEDLMLFYNVPAFMKGDVDAFLAGVARANGLLKKGGAPDAAGAARIVLRDWSTGKFPRYTNAPGGKEGVEGAGEWGDLYGRDGEVLEGTVGRKEMRKGAGVVRMVSGEVDTRRAAVEAGWRDGEDSEESGKRKREDEPTAVGRKKVSFDT